ncbi:hypothetical protein [Chroococcidiopsis thermalis]|uniref:Uncharacterized protein n=1 Tax=Chroococcidiopsis thermalis (strain PCC 7203) TaxID=251229 RepID=K9TWD2_CHRTP|nr:hypothetical protein [Chroococcidiopsis thermalis]AFY86708.1 hypothetical protein Chro_1181 [Chroococcidiopsis thermalis PCC 7203]
MDGLERQRALLPKELQDRFVYCPVTDEEYAIRHLASLMDRSWKYLKRPLSYHNFKADKEEIERRERKHHETIMSLSPKIRGWEIIGGERWVQETLRSIREGTGGGVIPN